jgi:hypothetical protein
VPEASTEEAEAKGEQEEAKEPETEKESEPEKKKEKTESSGSEEKVTEAPEEPEEIKTPDTPDSEEFFDAKEEHDEPKSESTEEPAAEEKKEPAAEPTSEPAEEPDTEPSEKEPDSEAERAKNDPNYYNQYDLLEHVLRFLDTDDELNPVLCGYFSKLVLEIFRKKTQSFLAYLYKIEGTMTKFVKHIYNRSICDVLCQILQETFALPSGEGDDETVQKVRKQVLQQLRRNLKSQDQNLQQEYYLNTFQIVQMVSKQDPNWVELFADEDFVTEIIKMAEAPGPRGTSCLRILSVLVERVTTPRNTSESRPMQSINADDDDVVTGEDDSSPTEASKTSEPEEKAPSFLVTSIIGKLLPKLEFILQFTPESNIDTTVRFD